MVKKTSLPLLCRLLTQAYPIRTVKLDLLFQTTMTTKVPAEYNSPDVTVWDEVLVRIWYSRDWLPLAERGTVVQPEYSSIKAIALKVKVPVQETKSYKKVTLRLEERPYKLAND